MGTKRFLTASILSIAIAIPAIAQFNIDDDVSDFGLWTSVGLEKKINKKWSAEFEGELRTADALNEVSRYSFGISTSYKICSWLKADAGYTLLRDYTRANSSLQWKEDEDDISYYEIDNEEDFWRTRHRFNISFTGSLKLGRFKISLRERWQYTYQPEITISQTETDVTRYNIEDWEWAKEMMGLIEYDGYLWQISDEGKVKEKAKRGKGSNVLRSRLEVSYDIKSVPFEPYLSCEMYHDDGGIKKTRYTIGGDYKIAKKHSIGLYYRYQDFSGSDEGESVHILGVRYKFKF
ncbi:MAG: DUF2490 domain-containing protein [Muribaculaceae bacterium]|nr:DUF2490 domain-containing protein [Muribaculaceae bacterium]